MCATSWANTDASSASLSVAEARIDGDMPAGHRECVEGAVADQVKAILGARLVAVGRDAPAEITDILGQLGILDEGHGPPGVADEFPTQPFFVQFGQARVAAPQARQVALGGRHSRRGAQAGGEYERQARQWENFPEHIG